MAKPLATEAHTLLIGVHDLLQRFGKLDRSALVADALAEPIAALRGSAEALRERLEITRLSNDTVRKFAASSNRNELEYYFSGLGTDQQQHFIEQRQLADLTSQYPGPLNAQQLVDLLREGTGASKSELENMFDPDSDPVLLRVAEEQHPYGGGAS